MINQNASGIALTKHLLLLCVSDILSAYVNDSWSPAFGVNYVVVFFLTAALERQCNS